MLPILIIFLVLEALLWGWVLYRGFARSKWRVVGSCLAYHLLVPGAIVMMLPFYWMVATSLKDFESANQSPPTWLPIGTDYFAPPPPGFSDMAAEIEVDLPKTAGKSWEEVQSMDSVTVVSIERLGDTTAFYETPGSSLRRTRGPQWSNYVQAWMGPAKGNPDNPVTFSTYFKVSIITTVVATLGTLLTSILAAYAFAKISFPGREILFYLVLATMMVPGQVLLIPDFLILAGLPDLTFGLRWLDNYPALIVPWLASVFSIFLLRQFFMGIPDDLWDAAQIDGSSRFRYLWQIMVPLSKPALITAGIFIFLGEWNSLLWPLIVTTSPKMRTLMVGLQTFNEEMSGDFHLLMAAATIAILPVVIVFFFLQRFFVQAISRTGFK
ncbi:carbohydrate ABC transporter permease [bacterium]|nr:carbohydrate ABC transporter permease [bacterium]